MKTFVSALMVLFTAGGIQVIAVSNQPPATAGDDLNPPPRIEETTKTDRKPSDSAARKSIRDHIFYGGSINLSFGNYTVIGIEPMVGYKLTPRLSSGVKARYNYIEDDRYATSRTTSTYGGSVFGRYLVTPKFYAQAEAASYNYEYFYFGGGSKREWVPFLFMGGGYVQPLGERTWMNIEILFDVLQDTKSPYEDWEPFLSIGVGTGF